jgi:ABC-2 type transport system permease protein
MFPLDLMPSALRSFSYAVPHSWALRGFQEMMVRGQGLQEIMPHIAALLGFALLFFLIAIWRFDFTEQETGL